MLASSFHKPAFLRQLGIAQTYGVGRSINRPRLHILSFSTDRKSDADGTNRDASKLMIYIHRWLDKLVVLKNHADSWATATGVAVSRLGSQLNRVSGYEEIEALKKTVVEQERRMNATRLGARQAKAAYDRAVDRRSQMQRDVNELLHRKSNWTDSDVSHFTALVRQDHTYDQEETSAKRAVQEAEDTVEREFSELMRLILARYHEEQIWSDKIRSASTYGSLIALTLNLLVFVTAIVVVEPWKRRQMTQAFEKRVVEMSLENAEMLDNGLREIRGYLKDQRELLLNMPARSKTPEEHTSSWIDHLRTTPHAGAKEVGIAAAAAATVAGLVGWLVRS